MYDLNFYILVWVILSAVAIPVVMLAALVMVLESIGDKQKAEQRRLQQFQNIDFLLSLLAKSASDKPALEEALAAFKKHHANMESLDPQGKEALKRLDFIAKISLMDFWDIDSVVKFRDELTAINKNLKKPIEQAVGNSLKNREKDKAKAKGK